jgi:uncharacterized protein (DUF433 family)
MTPDNDSQPGDRRMVVAPINHICVDDRGIAYIAGTRIKVRHIVVERNVWHKSPEEIQKEYPSLSLAQVYAALAYYYDQKDRIDAEIAEADQYAEQMHASHPNPLTREQFEARLQQEKDASP